MYSCSLRSAPPPYTSVQLQLISDGHSFDSIGEIDLNNSISEEKDIFDCILGTFDRFEQEGNDAPTKDS